MAAAWIFGGISVGCMMLFIYPYAIYPFALRLLSRRPVSLADCDLRVSLLFCAYNEIESLPDKLCNLRELKARRPDLQILVYDDSSADGTYELLASDPDLLTTFRGPGRTGKAAGMKQLVQHATGDVLLFTDANVLLSSDAIDRLLPYYGDDDVGGVCCTLEMKGDAGSETSQIGSLYGRLDDMLQRLESMTGNVMGGTGGLFSVRRELYPEFPDTVQDDFTVTMSVIFQGKRLIKAPDVIAYEKTVSEREEELRRKVRIGARAYHTHRFLLPQLRRMSFRDRFKYVSRKVTRWFGGLFLALAALFGLVAVASVSIGLAAALAVALLVAILVSLRARRGYLSKASEIALATFATLFGVFQAMRGRTMATWAPAKSR